MIPATAGGASAGAAARPFDNRTARDPGTTGRSAGGGPAGHGAPAAAPAAGPKAAGPAPACASAAGSRAAGSTAAGVSPKSGPAPVAGGREIRTSPDQSPSS